jgi:hypothetical protein
MKPIRFELFVRRNSFAQFRIEMYEGISSYFFGGYPDMRAKNTKLRLGLRDESSVRTGPEN